MMLDTTGRPPRSDVGVLPIAAAAALLLILFSGYFATLQNVWIDESTQLLGSELPLGRLFRWLAGGFEPLGVPGDRMPPGSYLLDWACARTACTNPVAFRALHVLAMAGGVFLATWVAGRRHGAIAGLVTGLFLALLPQTSLVGAEIRAYPILFLLTSVQLFVLSRLFDRHDLDWRGVGLFTAVSLLSTYTHFFGLIASSALFFGLFVSQVRSRQCILIVGGCWAVFLLLSLGLAPFIGGARSISSDPTPVATLGSVAAYLSRIVGSAPMLLLPGVMALFFLCLLVLIAAVGIVNGRTLMRAPLGLPMDFPVAILLAAIVGIAVTVLAAFVVHGFDPMKPSYSVWLLPIIGILVGIAASEARALAGVATAMLVALLILQANFLRHAELFVHGPERAIGEAIGRDTAGAAIVYRGGSWGYAYFPLIYRYGATLDHYHIDARGLHAIASGGDADTPAIDPHRLDRYRRLFLIDITTQTGGDLRHYLSGDRSSALTSPPPADPALFPAARWRDAGGLVRPGVYWLRLTRLERK